MMKPSSSCVLRSLRPGLLCALLVTSRGVAAPHVLGPSACEECHPREYHVWEGTKHFRSFTQVEGHPKTRDILRAVGDRSMKSSPTCVICHFTMARTDGGNQAVAGPSCENCHGPASDWIEIHAAPRKARPGLPGDPAEREERLSRAQKAGMNRPKHLYHIARNCMACHGLASPGIPGKVLELMLQAGHPILPEYELVRYSQGSVRHRFYPVPDGIVNLHRTRRELAHLFLVGQAARLVSAVAAIDRTHDPGYIAAQKERAEEAREALGKLQDHPAVARFLASPTESEAEALDEVLCLEDFGSRLSHELPDPGGYK